MRNWKRLMPNELMSDAAKRYKELFSSSMYVLRAVNKDDERLIRVGAGHFWMNDGTLWFHGSAHSWDVWKLCEEYRVWYYPLPEFDGIS